jgi:azurin
MVAHPAGHTPQSIVAVDVGPAVAADSHARTNPDTTITIRSLGSNLEFLPSEIAVKEGTNLRIRYVNEGTFPHNIVVVRAESDIDPLGLAAFDAAATGYVPSTKADRIVAHSTLASPGETVEFTFVVPPAGDYPFVCLYPGHYNMMVGTLRSLR